MSHACNRFFEMLQNPHVLLTFDKVHNLLHLPRKTTSERPKVLRTHRTLHFSPFDLEMCFAPQRRALFRHLNFQKCSEHEVFLAFSLANVLCAPTAFRTRRFSEPTFRPSGATNHWKNTVFRDFPTFSRTWIFFLLRLSLSSSLLCSDSSNLCFSICPYCRKFDF